MSDRAKQAADRIREHVPIVRVLAAYGYRVREEGGDREQQFSCDLHGDGRDSKPSARVYPASDSWYCISVHDRVLTEDGWIPLGALRSLACAAHDGSTWQVPTAYFPRGVQEVVKVRTRAGYEVTATADHKIEVVGRGWVPAGQIHPGDVLVVPKPREPRFAGNRPLPVADLNQQSYGYHPRLALPDQWSTELGEALGYVFGDGWVTHRQKPASGVVGLTSHSSDVEDARRVFRHMQTWASGRGSEVHRTDVSVVHGREYVQDQYVFTIGNDGFCEFFCRMGLDKTLPAHQRPVPGSIWQAPESGVRGFLRGVYGADGSVFRPTGRKGIRVNLYSVSEPFLRDVQLLLLQFGIHSRVYPPSNTRKQGRRTHPAGYLQLATGKDILAFRQRIGIASTRKQAVLDSYKYNPRGARPFRAVVESVVPAGVEEVADISMPVEHAFIAGGIKVHNCFACDRTRDVIQTVREKEGLEFWPAVKLLEESAGLDPLPYDGSWSKENVASEVAGLLDPQKTWEDDERRVRTLLDSITYERSMPLDAILKLWAVFDRIVYMTKGPDGKGGEWPENKGRAMLVKLRERILEAERGAG